MKTDYDEIVRPSISISNSQKVARFNSLLTGWIEKGWVVVDLGCNVGETTARLKELGSIPVGVSRFKTAIAYTTNKYPNIEFIHSPDEVEYLLGLKRTVDCVCIRSLLLEPDADVVKTISASLDRLNNTGTLIVNLNDERLIGTIAVAFPGLYLAYRTTYQTDTRDTFYFVVFRKRGCDFVG